MGAMSAEFLLVAVMVWALLAFCSPGSYGAYHALRERQRHAEAGHRFLCPHCLHFGDFQLANTSGTPVLEADFYCGWTGEVMAYCERCRNASDRGVYHERQVRVVPALTPEDVDAVRTATQGREWVPCPSGACWDDGAHLTYVLDLSSLYRRAADHTHALGAMDAVWTDGRSLEPLALGRTLDAMLRSGAFPETRWRQIMVCVALTELPPAVRNTLEGRFDMVRYGVLASEFLCRGREAAQNGSGHDRVAAPPKGPPGFRRTI